MEHLKKPSDPCATCSIGQDCCTRLIGLRLTDAEYRASFALHVNKLLVKQKGRMLIVSSTNGGVCPNYQNGCMIYDNRPLECRLFPFTIYVRRESAEKIALGFHSDTTCPQKALVKPSNADALEMVERFGRTIYGNNIALEVKKAQLAGRSLRWMRRRMEAIYNMCSVALPRVLGPKGSSIWRLVHSIAVIEARESTNLITTYNKENDK